MEIRKSGVYLIEEERVRQIDEEGWSAEHDDRHADGALAILGATLAVDGTDAYVEDPVGRGTPRLAEEGGYSDDEWGLVSKHGYKAKPDGTIRKLAIAGALIAAEIDRLQRVEDKKNEG